MNCLRLIRSNVCVSTRDVLRRFVLSKKGLFVLFLLFFSATFSYAQLTFGGTINAPSGKCQVWTAAHGFTETAAVNDEDFSEEYQWQRSQDISFPGGSVTNLSTAKIFTDNADLVGTWYYRRLVTRGGVTLSSNIITLVMMPSVSITGSLTVCQNATNPTLTITAVGGTAPYTITYSINGAAAVTATTTTGSGTMTGTLTLTVPTSTAGVFTYSLTSVVDANSLSETCTNTNVSSSATITVTALPTATITASSLTACVNTTAPVVTITGAGGTAPFTFTYREITDGTPGSNQVIVSNLAGVATFSATITSAATRVYELISVQESSATACANTQTSSVTIVTNSNPGVTGVNPALPAICFGTSNFNVTFSDVTGNPDQYRIVWNSAALFAGFTNDGFQTYNTTTNTITVNVPGTVTPNTTYSGTLRLANSSTGCFLENGSSVTINPLPTATITRSTAAVCVNGTIPTVTITAAGATAPYTVTYRVITDGVAGGNQVIVTNGAGEATINVPVTSAAVITYELVSVQESSVTACVNAQTASTTVTVNPLPTATIGSSSSSVCVNGTAPTVTLTGIGGTAPYTFVYTVNGGANQTITSTVNTATITVPVTAAGTFIYQLVSVQESSATACVNAQTASTTITVNPLPTATIARSTAAVCVNGTIPTVTITATGATAPYTVTYRVITDGVAGGNQVIVTNGAGEATINVPVTTAAVLTYELVSVQESSATNCVNAQTASTTVTINPLPSATIGSSSSAVCVNGTAPTVTLTGIGGTAPYTFVYTVNGGANQTITSTVNTATITVPVTAAGTFIYQLVSVQESSATACVNAQTASTTVTVNPLPTATIGSSSSSVCVNGTAPTVTLTGIGGTAPYTFVYTVNGGANQTITSTVNTATITVPVTAAGTFIYQLISVQESSVTACVNAQTASTTITVNSLPTVNIAAGSATTFCSGGSVTLTSTAGNSYLWSTGATSQSINVSIQGNYSVTMTDGNGCTNTSSVTPVLVNAIPVANITTSGPLTFCAGNSVDLTGTGGTSYAWSNGTNVAITNITTSGTYSVTVTNAAGCNAVTSTVVTVNALPTPGITASGPLTFCAGNSVDLTGTGGTSYAWSNGTNAAITNITTSGTYSVTVTNAAGCNAVTSTVVTVNALPVANINASGPLTFCAGGSVTLTGTGGTSYAWSNASTTASTTVNSTGTYTVTVIDGNGCQNTASRIVTVNALPVANINASGPLTFCAGGSVTLTGTGGTSYAWSNTATTASTTVNSTGTYTVTVTDGNGCQNTASRIVTVNALPVANINASGPLTFCAGGSVTLTGTGGTSYAWSNASTTASTTVNSTGTYTVTVTDGNGCQNTASRIVTVNSLPVANINASGPLTFCAGNSVNLTASNAVSYLWSNGITANTISNITNSGSFSVTITDANGCSNTSAPVVVTVNALPSLSITNPAAVCSPGTVNLTTAGITAGNSAGVQLSYWTNAAATSPLSIPSVVGTSGTYYIRATETINNCSVIRPVVVSILPQAAMVVNTPAAVCAPNTVDITNPIITTGSTNGLTYTYFTDALGTIALNTPNAIAQSGTYYIKGTPAAGCSAVVPVQVTINPSPVLVVNNPSAVCAPSLIDLTRTEITSGSDNDLRFNYFIDAAFAAEVGNPSQINNSGTYYIRATSNATGCRSSLPVTVTVNPIPSGQLQTPPVNFICENSSLTLTASDATNYQWLRNGQTIPGANAATYSATTAGTYTVRFISAQGCSRQATENIVLEILSQPVVDFSVSNACVGVTTSFQNRSQTNNSGGINWLWDFGDGSSSNQFSTQYVYQTPGVYQVKLTASNPNCSVGASKTMDYIVRSAARSIRYTDVETLRGMAVTINARNNIGNQYQWSPVTGVNQPTIASPSITVNETTLYTVSITSDIGCVTTDTVLVKVIPGTDIFVPQGFTPNNDGQNDRLFPILVGMRQLNYFKVFNRWGNMIFSTNSAVASDGWTGVYLGAVQPTGAYTWIAEAVDLQGRVVRRTGTVMLLR